VNRTIGVALALLALAAGSAASAVTLGYQGKAGEVRKYSFAVAMRTQSEDGGTRERMEGTITGLLAQRIKSVDDGLLTIEQKLTNGKTVMTVEGLDEPVKREMPEVTTSLKIDAQGRVKQFKPDETAIMMSPTQGLDRALAEFGILPERDSKVGDTWSGDRAIADPDLGTIRLHLTRKLVALESQDKRDCAKIETKFNGTLQPPPEMMGGDDMIGSQFDFSVGFSGTVVTWFDYPNGLIVREDVAMRMLTEMHFTMPAMGAGEDVEHSSKTAMIMNTKAVLQK
jgi:hypothetical protein